MPDHHEKDPRGTNPKPAELGLGAPRAGKGWYSRGYLPHADFPGTLQSIGYRLSDSLPAKVLTTLIAEIEALPPEKQDVERRRRIEALLDKGYGSCALRDPAMANCVVETWHHFAPERYDLIAWVVMPNHVHVLARLRDGWELGKVVQSWKSFTGSRLMAAHKVNWMRDYWDRFIRDEQHFDRTVAYIHNNPVIAGLVTHPEEWPWSSSPPPGTAEPPLGAPSPSSA